MGKLSKIALCLIGLGVFAMVVSYFFGATKNPEWRNKYRKELLNVKKVYKEESVRSIDLNMNVGKVTVLIGPDFKIDAKNVKKSTFQNQIKDGVWSIGDQKSWSPKLSSGYWPFFIGAKEREYVPSVTIYIPEEMAMEKVRINLKVGTLRIEKLVAKKSVLMEVEAGKIIVRDLEANNANVTCKTGIIYTKGNLLGTSKVKCSTGQVLLDMEGKETDYSYSLGCNLGRVRVNGKANSSFSSVYEIKNPGAPNNFYVECNVGKIGMTTKGSVK